MGTSAATDPIDLAIEGMTCAACVSRVERVLSRVPGVASAAVNLATERARITTAGPADVAAMIRSVEKAGYGAHEVEVAAPLVDVALAGQAKSTPLLKLSEHTGEK